MHTLPFGQILAVVTHKVEMIADWVFLELGVAKSTGGSGNGGEQYNNGNLQNDRGLGSKTTSTDFYITCVPNPTQNTFVLKSNQKKFVNVQLLDQTGKVVMEFVTLKVDKIIDISNLSTGIYTLVLEGHHIKINAYRKLYL